MWRKVIEYCSSDGGPMSVCPAQAFVNRISEAIVAENTPCDDDIYEDFQAVSDTDQDHRNDNGNDVGKNSPMQNISPDLGLNEVDGSDDDGNDADKQDAEEYADIEEYGDDSVIGGALSQWSLSAFENTLFNNAYTSNGDNNSDYCSDGADIIDCLDVDLDEM
ncbi:hypothetical protein IWW45_007817 [Coemansia sp. RSA 485]|nr:hypothetical protein IWW45_007817 [Coemansia sp. RSA 485]